MHRHPLFEVNDRIKVLGLIRDNSLGTLILPTRGLPYVDHLPFVASTPEGAPMRLVTHASAANGVWDEVHDGMECSVVFRGPDAYISPSWYPSRRQHGRVQPSWYYSVVNVSGRLRLVRDAEALTASIRHMTEHFERGQPDAWHPDEAPPGFIDSLLRHIVGLEIEVTGIAGKWQVGQQRNAADRLGIVEALRRPLVTPGARLADDILAAVSHRA